MMVNKEWIDKGCIDEPVEQGLNLKQEIRRMCKEKDAIILAHYYTVGEIQEIADFVGDSLALARKAAETDASCISSVSYIKPQPIISNKLYTNILLIFFIIKNGRVGFVSIAKILKKLQLNRFADDFFCDFA